VYLIINNETFSTPCHCEHSEAISSGLAPDCGRLLRYARNDGNISTMSQSGSEAISSMLFDEIHQVAEIRWLTH